MKTIKQYQLPILSLVFFLIYSVFPSTNSTTDAWGFAAYVKQGEGLFLSHHLFYNALGFLWVGLVHLFIKADTLKLLILLNAIFSVATLYILAKTLRLLSVEGMRLVVWIAFAGGSWAMLRYATENETYIIPLLFSMLGSYHFVKGYKQGISCNYIYSGFFAAVACLFHQVMFFWWISLLLGVLSRKKTTLFVRFAMPALIVPISYILVLALYQNQPLTLDVLLQFVFRDYYAGAAGVSLGLSSFLFTGINLFRSFFQVHGYFAYLPQNNLLFLIGGVAAICLILIGFVGFRKTQWKIREIKNLPVWVHLLGLILQIMFAFLSSGNAEFMVMVPILLAIVLSQLVQNEVQFFGFIAAGMVVWNVTLGLIPLHGFSLDSNRIMSNRILEGRENRQKQLFILFNKPGVENQVKYFTGDYPKNVVSGIQINDQPTLKQRIDIALQNDTAVITDCINRPSTLSRETLVTSIKKNELFDAYSQTTSDSVQTLTGKYFIYTISAKQKGEN